MINETHAGPAAARAGDVNLSAIAGRLVGLMVALALVCAAAAVITAAVLPFFGYRMAVIQGSSMAPAISRGTLIVGTETDPADLKVGDVITFRNEGSTMPLTHRIVNIVEVDGVPAFTTRGDANPTPDAKAVSFNAPVHRVVFEVPYAGYALEVLRDPRSLLLLLALPVLAAATLIILRAPGPQKARGDAQS